MKVLFIDANFQQREIYRIYLENIIPDAELLEADSVDLAKKRLEDIVDYDMILCSNNLPQGGAYQLYQHVRERSNSIHFALFCPTHPNQLQDFEGFLSLNSKNHHIMSPIVPGEFRSAILDILKPSYLNNMRIAAFQEVKILHFYRFNKVLCNVYIRLAENKYIKIINEDEIYSKDRLDHFKAKGVEHFYIANSDYQKFEVSFLNPSFLILDHQHTDDTDLAKTLISTHAILQNIALSLGFNKQNVDLADACITNLRQMIERDPNLTSIFQKISHKQDYIYNHSYLTAITAVEILNLIKWNNDARINNLCMAALMHDITLTNPALAAIEDINDPNLGNFTKAEIKEFLKHPLKIADMLLESPFANSEIVEIVRQHHENIDSTGFPCKLAPTKVSMPTAVFIVAHEFVQMMYEVEFDPTQSEEFRQQIKSKFNMANFAKITEAFANDLKKAS